MMFVGSKWIIIGGFITLLRNGFPYSELPKDIQEAIDAEIERRPSDQ